MIEGGEHPRFTLETRQPFGVARKRAWKDLDGDVAFQLRVTRSVDLAHPASPEARLDLIRAEATSYQGRRSEIAVHLCGPSGPVVLLCERRFTKLREELVEAIKWNQLRRRDLDAQRFT
jgi:hypothetical protein